MNRTAKAKTQDLFFWIFFALLTLTTLTILELNKNNLAAWAVCLALLGLYAFLRQRFLRGRHFYLRLAALLALLALLSQVMWGVGRPYKRRPAVEKSGGMTEVLSLRDGKVQGVKTADGAVEVFTGIPYAKPPV